MIAIRNILAPTDFSPHAEVGLRYACSLAEKFGARLHVLHILSEVVPVGPDPMIAPVLPPDYYTESEAQSQEALKDVIKPEWGKPAAIETVVKWGSPVEVVLEYARNSPIDLIVIATHGRTGLSHFLLGSVAERIVREGPCPVLTIRDHS